MEVDDCAITYLSTVARQAGGCTTSVPDPARLLKICHHRGVVNEGGGAAGVGTSFD